MISSSWFNWYLPSYVIISSGKFFLQYVSVLSLGQLCLPNLPICFLIAYLFPCCFCLYSSFYLYISVYSIPTFLFLPLSYSSVSVQLLSTPILISFSLQLFPIFLYFPNSPIHVYPIFWCLASSLVQDAALSKKQRKKNKKLSDRGEDTGAPTPSTTLPPSSSGTVPVLS